MDSKRCMISIKPMPPLKGLMMITGTRRINGKKDMAKRHKVKKKVYPNGYRIIIEKIQTSIKGKLLKTGTKELGNLGEE